MRKAQVQDIITLLLGLVLLIVIGFVSLTVLKEFRSSATGTFNQEGLDALDSTADGFLILDKFMMALVGMMIVILGVSAFKINTSIQFFVMTAFILGFVIFGAGMLSNVIDDFINDSALSSAKDDMPISVTIGRNLPTIGLVMGAVFLIALYGKSVGGSNL